MKADWDHAVERFTEYLPLHGTRPHISDAAGRISG
jgi:hypothetical protein